MNASKSWKTLLGVGLLLACLGCEEDVLPPEASDYPYSLWGVLDPRADTQYVRVFPVEAVLSPGEARPLDAAFVSTDLTTGRRQVWRDSVSVDARGVVDHLFSAPFRVDYGHTYRLQVTGDDGRASFVEVAVPVETTLELAPAETTQAILLPGFVRNRPPRLIQSTVEVLAGYVDGFSASGCPLYQFITLRLSFDRRIRPRDDGWWFVVDLREVYGLARERAEVDPAFVRPLGLLLGYVRFSTLVANHEWIAPEGTFDPEVLSQPGTMENVQNGFGFVGAGYRLSNQWQLPPRVVQLSGFRSDHAAC